MNLRVLIFFLIINSLNSFCSYGQTGVNWSENYSIIDHNLDISDAILDNNSNVSVLATTFEALTGDQDPFLVKYNQSGNVIFTWTNFKKGLFEYGGKLDSDFIGDLYLTTHTKNGPFLDDTVRVIKLDGLTGQEIYNYNYAGTEVGISLIKVQNQHFYVAMRGPINQLYKYDLQGNVIWNIPVSGMLNFWSLHFYQNYVYLIGENFQNNINSYLVVQKFDSTGSFIWSQNVDPSNFIDTYQDSKCDLNGNIWLTGNYTTNTSSNGYLNVINDVGAVWDTLIIGNTGIAQNRLEVDSLGNVFFSFYSATAITSSTMLFRVDYPNFNLLSVLDSSKLGGYSFLGSDLLSGAPNDILIVHTRRGTGPSNHDFEICNYDSLGLLKWNYINTYGSPTRETPFKIFSNSNYIYTVNQFIDFAISGIQVQVVQFDLLTSEPEHIKNNADEIILYPNPATNELTIEMNFEKIDDITLELYNLYGQKLQDFYHEKLISKKLIITIDISDYSKGLYFIKAGGRFAKSSYFVKY
jgi:type IX secretion system substrate protein